MHVGNSPYTLSDGSGECVQLKKADQEKDLGVWFTRDLKPSLHCCKAAASAMKILSMIRRSFANMSKELFVFLYTTYVRLYIWNILYLFGVLIL